MKTLADFKKKLIVGNKLKLQRFENIEGLWKEDLKMSLTREISKVMSTQFALATEDKGKMVDSYCDYPKKHEYTFIDDNTIEIILHRVKLVYSFVEQ